jgi:hydroxyacylglutathione hydrolase
VSVTQPVIATRTVGPFQENCYLVRDPAAAGGVLIDPGDEAPELLRMIDREQVTLEAMWLTHAHLDHIGAVEAIRRRWPVPVLLHPADRPLFDRASAQAAFYGLPFEQPSPPDGELADGMVLRTGELAFEVLHMPGHAPGHVIFVGHGVVLGGDLLFAGSVCRTDLPMSDPRAMQSSLDRLAMLDESLVVHPGHGPATTIGAERASNPFLAAASGRVR